MLSFWFLICWLGDFPIAHVFPMGFGCKCLIIRFLVFWGFPFATCFFWGNGQGKFGSGERERGVVLG